MNKGRKITSGKYHRERKHKSFEKLNQERKVVLGKTKTRTLRARAGKIKTTLLKSNQVNIIVDGKAKKTEIVNVEETPQNRFFSRENRLMKGAIIQTPLGKARITNRPSQEGQVNAILVK